MLPSHSPFGDRVMAYRSLTSLLLIVYLFVYPVILLCDLQCGIDSRSIRYERQTPYHVHRTEGIIDYHAGYGHDNPTGDHHPTGNRHGKHTGCLFAHSASYHGILTRVLQIPGIIDNTPSHCFHSCGVIPGAFYSDIHYRSPPYSIQI